MPRMSKHVEFGFWYSFDDDCSWFMHHDLRVVRFYRNALKKAGHGVQGILKTTSFRIPCDIRKVRS